MDKKLDKDTIRFIRNEVMHFGASIIIEGNNESIEDKITSAYADGTVKGYNDAVKQIGDFLEDLLIA